MIEIFVLSFVLLVSASLGWGFVFAIDVVRLGKRSLIYSISVSTVLSVFTAVFVLKGMSEWADGIGIITMSLVFASTFALVLAAGIFLATNSLPAELFKYVENVLRGSEKKDERAEIIGEILDLSSETGQLDILERELIESVLKFNDKTVREVMVPRGDIVAINIEEDRRHFLHKVIEEGYSRLPVFRQSVDNIVGIIYAKDLLTMVENDAVIVLQDLLRPPYYVPVNKKISQLLREIQRDKVHLAVVVDEFGGTEGIVTLEDVLEEIVGEIQDEYDENPSEVVHDANGDVHISGSMTVNRYNELLKAEIPQSEHYDTMAGFVQKLAGKLPQKDEIYNYEETFFIVEDVARHRIKRLRISFKEHPSQDSIRVNLPLDSGSRTDPVASRKDGIGNKVERDVAAARSKNTSLRGRKSSSNKSRGKAKKTSRTGKKRR